MKQSYVRYEHKTNIQEGVKNLFLLAIIFCIHTPKPKPHTYFYADYIRFLGEYVYIYIYFFSVLLPHIVPRFKTSWSHTSTPKCIFLTQCLIMDKF